MTLCFITVHKNRLVEKTSGYAPHVTEADHEVKNGAIGTLCLLVILAISSLVVLSDLPILTLQIVTLHSIKGPYLSNFLRNFDMPKMHKTVTNKK